MPERWKKYSEWFILSLSLTLINHGGFISDNPVFGMVLWPFFTIVREIVDSMLHCKRSVGTAGGIVVQHAVYPPSTPARKMSKRWRRIAIVKTKVGQPIVQDWYEASGGARIRARSSR